MYQEDLENMNDVQLLFRLSQSMWKIIKHLNDENNLLKHKIQLLERKEDLLEYKTKLLEQRYKKL